VPEVHLVVGVALIAANLIAGVWGGYLWLERKLSEGFWTAVRIAQAAVVLQAVLGLYLAFTGHHAKQLHYLYGALPLVVSLVAELVRAGSRAQDLGDLGIRDLPEEQQTKVAFAIYRRETGIMATACLVIFLIALRAAGTSTAF
jgi:Flp pilus assembly protein TadB